jgi:hypothetical protein
MIDLNKITSNTIEIIKQARALCGFLEEMMKTLGK